MRKPFFPVLMELYFSAPPPSRIHLFYSPLKALIPLPDNFNFVCAECACNQTAMARDPIVAYVPVAVSQHYNFIRHNNPPFRAVFILSQGLFFRGMLIWCCGC